MSEIRSQTTPARDELAEAMVDDLFEAENCGELMTWDDNGTPWVNREAIAETLVPKGWSKPRTVNSIEEALTLPQGTVIRPGPIVWPRSGEISVNISDQRHYVHWTGSDCPDELATWMLPFTVLFTPGEAG